MSRAKDPAGYLEAYAAHSQPTMGRPQAIRANPGPLGLLCFGMTTCMYMFVAAGWAQTPFFNQVLGYAMIYGGATQLVIGFLQFVRGDGMAGAASCSYSCFWIGWFINNVLAKQHLTNGGDKAGEMLWLALWGVLSLCFFLFTLRKSINIQVVFATLTVAFFLLAAGVRSAPVQKAGGYFGLACGVSAIYAGMADLAEEELGLLLPGKRVWWPLRVADAPHKRDDSARAAV